MNVKKVRIKHHFITACCATVLVGGVVAYMYFLSLSVVHVVMRKEVLQETNRLRSEIAFLETSYIEAHHTISSRVATADGFTEIRDKIFISATPGASLVLRTAGE